MIIRKPYAFLIKYFKIIHIILFAIMAYFAYKTFNLLTFFNNFTKTGTYTYYDNMTFKYINIFMIVLAIILVGALLMIFFLMKKKEKKVLYYLLAIIFYSITFVIFIYLMSVFSSLEFTTYNNQSLVIFRDMSLIVYSLNYIFLAVAFVRGFGFNIKKFNFEKDIEELDVSAEDREEFELGTGFDTEQVGDYFRKKKRNFSYYLKENSYVLIILGIITTFIIASIVSINMFVINKVYRMNSVININNIKYVVNNCYVIDKDINGLTIKKDTYYVVIDLSMKNMNDENYTLDISKTRIKINDKYYYPKTSVSSKLNEFGVIYKKQSLKPNIDNNYIVVFEVDKDYKNILLEIYSGKNNSGNDDSYSYKKVKIVPYNFKEVNLGEYKLNDKISLSKTYLKKGNLVITNMEVLDSESYTYKICSSEDNCQEYPKVVAINGNNKILKITYDLDIDKNIFSYLKVNNKILKNITPNNYPENSLLFEVPNTGTFENISIVFDIRNAIIKVTK